MAKVTAPFLSFGGSGTIAKTLVASKWKGRPYMRQHVVPSNPNSAAQQTTRAVFSQANAVWKLMGPLLAAPWNSFASGQVLTGRNAFVSRFVSNVRGEVDYNLMEFSPGAKGGLPPSSLVITPGSNQLSCAVGAPTPPAGWTLVGAQAAAILDQDPASATDFVTVEAEDLIDPYEVVLSGLTASVQYHVGAWLTWTKPDGSLAYGASLLAQATPTV